MTASALRLLVVASETPDQQEARRKRSGEASHETYARTLRRMTPEASLEHISCLEKGGEVEAGWLAGFDGVVFPGSPIQMHRQTQETRAAAAFMERVFESGTPSFGSCAGLQIAVVGAGGTTKPREDAMRAAITRNIAPVGAGRGHPLFAGRPASWDAPAMHSSVVDAMPEGGTVLAATKGTPVEAAEIRRGNALFWGVQYHPELTLDEVADALEGQSDALVEQGLAQSKADVARHARLLTVLARDPERHDLAWQLGLNDEVTDEAQRTREIGNALRMFAERA